MRGLIDGAVDNVGRIITDHKIAVCFEYEYHDDTGQWFRAHGNENWTFDADGYMARREASINDVPILESERQFR
jgi:hypothetical protein